MVCPNSRQGDLKGNSRGTFVDGVLKAAARRPHGELQGELLLTVYLRLLQGGLKGNSKGTLVDGVHKTARRGPQGQLKGDSC